MKLPSPQLMLDATLLMVITPQMSPPKCGATRFRWSLQIDLPFILPFRKCPERQVTVKGVGLDLAIHNHLDRVVLDPRTYGTPRYYLQSKSARPKPGTPPPPVAGRVQRLKSIAIFRDTTESESVQIAFDRGKGIVKDCIPVLSEFLRELQRQLPFAGTWAVHPVSFLDIDLHHGLEHFCPKSNRWEFLQGGVIFSAPKNLDAPLFVIDLAALPPESEELRLIYELLAEAQLATLRMSYRLSILNSVMAVELLAQNLYSKQRQEQLEGWGVPTVEAERVAEEKRMQHRTDEKFLLSAGPKETTQRSLAEEKKSLYDDFIQMKKLRHQVAHAGVLPTDEQAKQCYSVCCQVVRWLCEVYGLPIKAERPDDNQYTNSLTLSGG